MLRISITARLIRNAKIQNYKYGDKSYQTKRKHNKLGPRKMRTVEYILNNAWMKELTQQQKMLLLAKSTLERKEKDGAVCIKYFGVELATKHRTAKNNDMICEQNN
jgi:hypothetical protein